MPQDAKAYRIGMSLHRVNQVLCQFNDLDTISQNRPRDPELRISARATAHDYAVPSLRRTGMHLTPAASNLSAHKGQAHVSRYVRRQELARG